MTGMERNSSPKVSVIINCYNGEEYLNEAIDSIYEQTFSNWEIIFWDNCSTDRSAEIAKSYDQRLRYFLATENTPLGEARNLALTKALGQYVAFIDCDDIWLPTKLARQVEQMDSNSTYALSYHGVEEVDMEGEHFRYYIPKYKSGDILKDLLVDFNIHIIASMIRRSSLEESGLDFDRNMSASEEYCLFMQLSARYEFGVISEPLAKYRVVQDSLTSKKRDRWGYERRYTLDRIEPFLESRGETLSRPFKIAMARSFYYDAKYHMAEKRRFKAFNVMLKTQLIDLRYIPLLMLTMLPFWFWDKIHTHFRNRS